MSCNPTKCKELTFTEKGVELSSGLTCGIPKCNELTILGITLQSDTRCTKHLHEKIAKANRSLYVLRTLRKEGYVQAEIDHLFKSVVLPNISYGLTVYGASKAEHSSVQCFPDRCCKRKFFFFKTVMAKHSGE